MGIFQKKRRLPYNPETQEPVVRKSICTGEMTVGYVDKPGGKFHELRLVRSRAELEEFCRENGITDIRTIY